MKTIILTDTGNNRVIADSALGRNHHPWFLPDFGRDWTWHCAPALRISRLGKGVRPEFAGRYVEERTLAWIPEATENPAPDFMDGAVIFGDWIPVGPGGLTPEESDAIVKVARFSTIKQGDVIIIDSADSLRYPVNINEKIQVELEGRQVIEVSIK
ncbi:MAG: hypothetical protein HDR75_05110 [Bacteroides sp.]|nr:hypothetical protein [Bacteroides sp.]